MAQALARKTLTVFGLSGGTSNFGQFGSQAASAPVETKDVSTIQALTAWVDGWQDAVALGQAPYLQDMNGVMYVHSYEQAYVFQEGISEWDAGTTYNKGSVVKLPYTGGNNFQLFVSLVDANLNLALPTAPSSNSNWQFVFGFVSGVFRMGTGLGFGNYAAQGIIGTATNDDAAAGYVGEEIRSHVGGTAASATGTWDDGTSIPLTAGDWDVTAILNPEANGATWTEVDLGIGLTGGNSGAGLVDGDNQVRWAFAATSTVPQDFTLSIPTYRISLAAPATVYLKRRFVFSAGTPQSTGCRLSARRVR